MSTGQKIQLYIGTNDLAVLENIEQYLEVNNKTEEQIKQHLKSLKLGNKPISPQYQINIDSLKKIKDPKMFDKNFISKIKGFYFGNDTCERLIPSLETIKKAIKIVQTKNKRPGIPFRQTITLVTPYVGNAGLARLKEIFEYLNNLNWEIEVVVNDWGVLWEVSQNYPNIIPIAGRLMNKAQRNALIGDKARPNVPSFLGEKIRQNIASQQEKYYHSNEYTLPFSPGKLKELGVDRLGFDYAGLGLRKKQDQNIDIYYPRAVVTGGRNCWTAGIVDKKREYYQMDTPCSQPCRQFDILLPGMDDLTITHRGNSVYKAGIDIFKIDKSFLERNENRLVYLPFVLV